MNFLLECVVLEVTEKQFLDNDGKEQTFFIAQSYQPGIGVGEITIAKDVVKSISPGKSGQFVVVLRNGKPRIIEKLK